MTLRAGFATVDVTPGPELSLMGYDFRRTDLPAGNAGVHDPLYARALVFSDGTVPAVLVSVDLCVIPNELARRYRQRIAEQLQTDMSRVILSATHTHSGPFPMSAEMAVERGDMATVESTPTPEVAYAQKLETALLEVAAKAGGLTFPVEVRARNAPMGIAYNRRVMTDEGIAHVWGPQEFPNLAPEPAPDLTCSVVEFAQLGGPRRTILWNFGAHPVVLGKTSRVVSGDYPGAACHLIEAQVPGAHAIFLLGAAGDAQPWISTQEDPANLDPVARAAASFVALLSHATRPITVERPLQTAAKTVVIGDKTLDLVVWRLGGLWLVALPVELFGVLGHEIRDTLGEPDGAVLLATLSNGWTGYWPTQAAFDEGGYEVENALRSLSPGDGERLVAEALALAEELKVADRA